VALILEPGAGVAPWVSLINQAHTGIDLNAYLIDNPTIFAALRQAGSRGVPIHVLLAPNPYDDLQAVPAERQALAAIPHCTVRNAPPRFDTAYAYDHAKYLVINPGTPQATAILGTPNFTDSAVDGQNLEAAAQVFQADWTDRPVGPGPRRTLVLSPGATPVLASLLQASGSIQMMTEEVGDEPALLALMAADGARLQLLVPPPTSTTTAARLAALAAAGVRIRTLSAPYVHAKVLVTPTTAFLGSQNLSPVSLQDNREMGLIVTGSSRAQLATWFDQWWVRAAPWSPASFGPTRSPSQPIVSHHRPWLPDGASMATVRQLWGPPDRTYPTTYHGQSQIAWVYPTATVYFVGQRLVAVVDH
jgi:phosphatidylserine/phosphatidylglycerophosphate/cardiolipin synthase-like enzyme